MRVAAVGHVLPEEVVTPQALETRPQPPYRALGLQEGQLEQMTGIRERRFFPRGTRPSAIAAAAGELALERCGIARERIGALIHASVCRDFLEPATASVVHARLQLAPTCTAFDLSNACLGFVNAVQTIASQIELGHVDAGLVVAGEDGRALVESTLELLLAQRAPSKAELKSAFASLTIGSRRGDGARARRARAARTAAVGRDLARGDGHHQLCQATDRPMARGCGCKPTPRR